MQNDYDNETNKNKGLDNVDVFFYMCLVVVALLLIGFILFIANT